MKFRHLISVAAAMSLMAVSSAAVAQSAPLYAPQPSKEKVKGDSEIGGTTVFIALLALSAVVAGVTVAVTSDDTPASP